MVRGVIRADYDTEILSFYWYLNHTHSGSVDHGVSRIWVRDTEKCIHDPLFHRVEFLFTHGGERPFAKPHQNRGSTVDLILVGI